MRFKANVSLSLVAALAAVFGTTVRASADDYQFGTSRFAGMGGAGLALPFGGVNTIAYNGARYAYNKGFNLTGLDIAEDYSGVTLNHLSSLLKTNYGSGFGTADLANIAQNFGTQNANVQIEGGLTLGLGPFSIGASSGVAIATRPNAALEAWAKGSTTSDITTLPTNAYLDAYGYGYTSIDLGAGTRLGPQDQAGGVTFGGRVRFMRGYYAHYAGDQQTIIATEESNSVNAQAPEMNGANYLDKNAVGADIGTQVKLDATGNQFAGLEVDNLIEPSVTFQGTAPNGGPLNQTFSAFKRQFNVGYGATTADKKLIFAFDVHDIGNHAGFQEIRTGASFQLTSFLSVSAGYGTVHGASIGLQMFGFALSLSKTQPLALSRVFKF